MKRKLIIIILLLLAFMGTSLGIYAFSLVNLQKADGSGTVKYIDNSTVVTIPSTYDQQDTDFRAVWVSHLVGDVAKYTSKDQYMTEMEKVFQVMEYYNMNAMIFHIRTHNNALYDSDLNPVASYYSTVNFDTWDPLKWIIEESHKRGIEFHAWMNPYRLSTSYSGTVEEYAAIMPSYNLASNPEMLLKSGSTLIFNPGEPQVREFIIDSVMEVIQKYDVDAIHFDDYFYVSGVDDTVTRNKYNTTNLSLGDFRRLQVDIFVRDLYQTMKSYNLENNRTVQLGISPSGVYRSGAFVPMSQYRYDNNGTLTYPLYSATTTTFEHYDNYLYSDTKKWVDNEWIDYILPQAYWSFEQSAAGFAPVMDWWSGVVKNKKVNLYSGMGLYKILETKDTYSWSSSNEAYNQILYGTKYPEIKGHSIYSFKHLKYALDGTDNILFQQNFSQIKENAWTKKAILPEVETYAPINLGKVQNLSISEVTNGYKLNFNKLDGAKFYVIYRSQNLLTYSQSEVIDIIGASETDDSLNYIDTVSGDYFYGVRPMSSTNTLGTESSISTTSQLLVLFKDYNGAILKAQYVNSGESATAPSNPIREGHTFTGWDKQFTNITTNLEVNALYTPNQFQVVFKNYDGAILGSTNANYGQSVTAPSVPPRIGYNFTGWDTDIANITADTIATAQFSKKVYKVRFLDYDNTILYTENVEYGEDATAPNNPTRTGYSFAGWDRQFTNITNHIDVKATYTGKYNIIFKIDDKVILSTDTESEFTIPDIPTKTGYDKVAPVWNITDFSNITSDTVVEAIYTINTYNVKFYGLNQRLLKEETVEWGKSATAPTPAYEEGYRFSAWDQDFSKITNDIEIKAQYLDLEDNSISCSSLNLTSIISTLGILLIILLRRKH